MGRLIVGAHPTECLVRTLAAVLEVRRLQPRKRIGRQRIAFRIHVEAVNLGCIQPEDLLLVFLGDKLGLFKAMSGAGPGEARLKELITSAGFSTFHRAAQTPFNLILEARP